MNESYNIGNILKDGSVESESCSCCSRELILKDGVYHLEWPDGESFDRSDFESYRDRLIEQLERVTDLLEGMK